LSGGNEETVVRFNTVLAAGIVSTLFVVSIVAGYIWGEKYFKPGGRPAPVAPATPRTGDLTPPTVPPAPSDLATPRLAPPGPATPAPTLPPVPGPGAVESPGPAPVPRITEPSPPAPRAEPTLAGRLFIVQVGAFASRENADALVARLRADGFNPYLVKDRTLLKVRVGAFQDRARADELAQRLRARGYPVSVIH
jgi:cell division septation protein DedD